MKIENNFGKNYFILLFIAVILLSVIDPTLSWIRLLKCKHQIKTHVPYDPSQYGNDEKVSLSRPGSLTGSLPKNNKKPETTTTIPPQKKNLPKTKRHVAFGPAAAASPPQQNDAKTTDASQVRTPTTATPLTATAKLEAPPPTPMSPSTPKPTKAPPSTPVAVKPPKLVR